LNIEYIVLIASASISLIGVIISLFSVLKIGKQVNIQKKQWEHSHVPVFKFLYQTDFDGSYAFVVENPNNVYHRINKINFTNSEVSVKDFWYGSVGSKETLNNEVISEKEYKGLIIVLSPNNKECHKGLLQISGVDGLGNTFRVTSKEMIFKEHKIHNHFHLTETYLNKI
jgi:hypothetical protein